MRGPWHFEEPLCAEVNGDFWFPDTKTETRETRQAKKICGSCIHKNECLEWALEHESFGIWGGTNEHNRKLMRRQRNMKSA